MALLERAGLPSGAANVARYLRWQPDGCWCNDEVTGMVTVLRQGTVGFVGCMAVEPSEQGRGIGRTLIEHAQAMARRAGVSTFLLEATPDGRRLYEKLGYVLEHTTLNMARDLGVGNGSVLEVIALADRDVVLALDAAATGTTRPMIADLIAKCPGIAVRTRGELVAYGLVIGDRLGPAVSCDADPGRAVVSALAPGCRLATVPVPNEVAHDALAHAGFTDVRELARMRLGPPVPSRVDWVWALASAGAG
jgi:predicted GNAT family acetyltransferase